MNILHLLFKFKIVLIFNLFIMRFICGILVFLVLSCQAEDQEHFNSFEDARLIGEWSYSIEMNSQELLVYDLVINEDSTFIWKVSRFAYENQNVGDLLWWSEYSGALEVRSPNSLILKSETNRWWESFYDMTPITETSSRLIYEDCTYTIINNTLKLSYTTYPADAPEETEMILTKVE